MTEDSTGQIYRASTVYGHNFDNPMTVRSSAAYITGTHNYKAGFTLRVRGNGPTYNNTDVNGNMNYNFLNGVPRRVTLYATPIAQRNDIKSGPWHLRAGFMGDEPDDDQLRHPLRLPARRVFRRSILRPGSSSPSAISPPVENAPKWSDINPRLGVSYNVFGDGKTVAKFTIGRYISGGSSRRTSTR